MTLNWETLRQDNPVAVQVIEKMTGFTYETAYGSLIKDKRAIRFDDLERFFDEWGWRMAVLPAAYPNWSLVIINRSDDTVYSEIANEDISSRNHAKSKVAGVAITLLNQMLIETFALDGSELIVERKDLLPWAEEKLLGTLTPSDFSLDAQGLIAHHDIALYRVNDDYVVLKNAKGKLPFPGLILTYPS